MDAFNYLSVMVPTVLGIALMLLCAWTTNRRVHAGSTLLVIVMLVSTTLLTRYRLGQTQME